VPLWRSSARRSSTAAWCPGSSSSTGTAWPARRAGEIRSWERSLHTLSADLVQAGLDDVEVLVEYQLPLTSKRADVVLCGVHPRTGQPSYVVVELKQWSSASLLRTRSICVLCRRTEGRGCTPVSRYGGTAATWATSSRRWPI
jgi:hypothetical protein